MGIVTQTGKNFISLSTLQVVNFLAPLILIPYLLRTIGAEQYGLVVFAQAFAQYFVLIGDFGVSVSGTRYVAIADNSNQLSILVSSLLTLKSILIFVLFAAYLIIVYLFDKFNYDILLFLLCFLLVIGTTFFPKWFFMGIGNMKILLFSETIRKSIVIVLVLVFVKNVNDYILVVLFNGISSIVLAIVGIYMMYKWHNIKWILPTKNQLFNLLDKTIFIFLSNLYAGIYANSNIFILGLLSNPESVAYYSVGEKLVKSIQMIFMPFWQALFPTLSKLFKENMHKAMLIVNRIGFMVFCVTFACAIAVYYGAPIITKIIYSKINYQGVIVIKILCMLPLVAALGNLYGTQFLINVGKSKEFSNIVMVGCIISLIICPILVYYYDYIGASVSLVISESLVTMLLIYYVYKYIKKSERTNSDLGKNEWE